LPITNRISAMCQSCNQPLGARFTPNREIQLDVSDPIPQYGVHMYDFILKNGFIIDPLQEINRKTSLAIRKGKIALIGDELDENSSRMTIDLEGKIVIPGIIDIHCHVDSDFSFIGLPADEIGLHTGVTLLCDAGSSGCANFATFRRCLMSAGPVTDVCCFLNLSQSGLIAMPEIRTIKDINFEKSKDVIEANLDLIKGVKLRLTDSLLENAGMEGVEIAKKLADSVGLPVMFHLGETRKRKETTDPLDDFSRTAVALMDDGDILSHYLTWEPGGMIREDGVIYPELGKARKRGVVLDSCHGLNHFDFTIARIAIEQGFIPTVISTDMATMVRPAAQSMAVCMSKFMMLGLNLEQVVEMTTSNPATALKEEKYRGSLKKGMKADITIFEQKVGSYSYMDRRGGTIMEGDKLLEPYMVFKDGHPYPAWSGYHLPRKDLVMDGTN
jgi:dihydroorotase